MNYQQALNNIAALHAQVRLTPQVHEAVKESILVLNEFFSPKKSDQKYQIGPNDAFNNLAAMYNASQMSLQEHEALKASFEFIATELQKEGNFPVSKQLNNT